MKIGITGHQHLDNSAEWDWVRAQIALTLGPYGATVIGITSLAIGADQVFAQAVLDQNGHIEAVIPFQGYENDFHAGPDREAYDRLLGRASAVEILVKAGTEEQAFLAAGKRVVDASGLLIAVWDGKPAGGLGGTADVVKYARDTAKRVVHIDPSRHETVSY